MKPILFNTQMVQAILQGRKTCTRRIVKPKSKNACGFTITYDCNNKFKDVYDHDANEGMFDSPQSRYHVGDILYVRETWQLTNPVGDYALGNRTAEYKYKAGYGIGIRTSITNDKALGKWKPSIHMPKEAARIFLKVTDVRVEKLQDITDEGAKKEGADYKQKYYYPFASKRKYRKHKECLYPEPFEGDYRTTFAQIWDDTLDIHSLESWKYMFKSNPWVWVIEFERISREE